MKRSMVPVVLGIGGVATLLLLSKRSEPEVNTDLPNDNEDLVFEETDPDMPPGVDLGAEESEQEYNV